METEAQRGKVTYPWPYSQHGPGSGRGPLAAGSRDLFTFLHVFLSLNKDQDHEPSVLKMDMNVPTSLAVGRNSWDLTLPQLTAARALSLLSRCGFWISWCSLAVWLREEGKLSWVWLRLGGSPWHVVGPDLQYMPRSVGKHSLMPDIKPPTWCQQAPRTGEKVRVGSWAVGSSAILDGLYSTHDTLWDREWKAGGKIPSPPLLSTCCLYQHGGYAESSVLWRQPDYEPRWEAKSPALKLHLFSPFILCPTMHVWSVVGPCHTLQATGNWGPSKWVLCSEERLSWRSQVKE